MGVENRRKSLCSFRRGLLGILVPTPLPRPLDALDALEVQDALDALEVQDARGALEVQDALDALEVQDARGALEVQDAPLHRDCFLPDAVVEDDVRRASGDGEGGR